MSKVDGTAQTDEGDLPCEEGTKGSGSPETTSVSGGGRQNMAADQLYVIPATHPQEAARPAHERDETVATALGAVWGEGRKSMHIPHGVPEHHARQLRRRFATPAAKERYENAYERLRDLETEGRADDAAIATAASTVYGAAVRGRPASIAGGTRNGRVYYYSVPDQNSEFSTSKLLWTARELGADLHVDRDTKEGGGRFPTYGVHYSKKTKYGQLAAFTSDAARQAWEEEAKKTFVRHRKEGRETWSLSEELIQEAALLYNLAEGETLIPLTLPRLPSNDASLDSDRAQQSRTFYVRAAEEILKCPIDRLEKLVALTEKTVANFEEDERIDKQLAESMGREEALNISNDPQGVRVRARTMALARMRRGLAYGRQVLKAKRERNAGRSDQMTHETTRGSAARRGGGGPEMS